jgi:hypothetical protein
MALPAALPAARLPVIGIMRLGGVGTMWRLKAALAAVVFLSATCASAAWAQSGLCTMSLMDFEGPVMAESATGSNVAQWTTEPTKIKAQGVVKPLLAASPQ